MASETPPKQTSAIRSSFSRKNKPLEPAMQFPAFALPDRIGLDIAATCNALAEFIYGTTSQSHDHAVKSV